VNILTLLQNLDRRWLYALLLLTVTVPFFLKIRLPVTVSPPTQKLYDKIESMPEGSFVLFGVDWGPGTRGENGAQTEVMMRHLMQRKIRFALLAFAPEPSVLCQNIAVKLQKEYNETHPEYGVQEGVTWVNWGYKVDQVNILKALVRDVPATVSADVHNHTIADLPVMKGIHSAKDISLILNVNPTASYQAYIQFVQGPYKIPMGLAPTAVMAPETYTYLDSGQLVGMLNGLQGAIEYEQLLGVIGRATVDSNSLSFAHLLIISLILLGNIAMLLERSQRARAGGAR